MRAHAVVVERFEGPASLVWRQVDVNAPGPGEVAIEVHDAGVNFPDLLVSRGSYQTLFPLPFVIGKEGAGIVCAVGPDVNTLAVGSRVAFQLEAGAFSERVLAPANQCYPVPDGLALRDAGAMVIAYQTAYFALTDRGGLKKGDWVLVLGASGGVGIAAVQIAKALGARVIAATGSSEKAQFALAHGADAVVDTGSSDGLREGLRRQVHEITGGRGVGLAIDNVGGDAFDAALRVLAPGGCLVVVGFASGRIPTVKVNYLLLKHIAVVGVNWGVYRDGDPRRVAEIQARIFELAVSGRLASPVTQTLAMARAAEALVALDERRARGKIVLTTRREV